MSSIRNITASTAVPDDLAKRLGPSGVNEILLTLWQGYHDLVAATDITISETANEDDITLEWYGKISQRWTNENRATTLRANHIGPVHQYPDPTLKKHCGYKPTSLPLFSSRPGVVFCVFQRSCILGMTLPTIRAASCCIRLVECV